MEIADIQRTVEIGSVIEVTLNGGKEISGRLIQLSEGAIAVESDSREVVISIAAIALVSSHKKDISTVDFIKPIRYPAEAIFPNAANGNHSNQPILETAQRLQTSICEDAGAKPQEAQDIRSQMDITDKPADAQALPPKVVSGIVADSSREMDVRHHELLKRVITTYAEFRTALTVCRIDPVGFVEVLPDPESYQLSWEQRRGLLSIWDSCRQRYHYALDSKDLSRFQQIIFTFRTALREHPSVWYIHFNIGSLYLSLEKNLAAAQWFLDAARISNTALPFYNASIALLRHGDSTGAQDALIEFFRRHAITVDMPAWYTLLKLGMQEKTTGYLDEMAEIASRNERIDDVHTIVRTVQFMLQGEGLEDGALALEAAFDSDIATLLSVFRTWVHRMSHGGQTRPPLVTRIDSPTILIRPRSPKAASPTRVVAPAVPSRPLQPKSQPRSAKSTLDRAESLARAGQFDAALAAVRQVLKDEPDNKAAQRREDDFLAKIRITTLPSGEGPYRRAKQAETVERDLAKAERLYLEAIATEDRLESAVKDLALILAGQNRPEEGIELLLQYRSKMKAQLPYMQTLVMIYQKTEEYQKIIPLLHSIHGLVPANRQIEILRRIAVTHTKLGEYDRAEDTLTEVLRHSPEDISAKTLLESLRQARETGTYAALQSPLPPMELYVESRSRLSDFLNYFLEKCDYEGVRASTRASGEFTEDDVKFLDGKLGAGSQLGPERPEERAAYYLSAAKVLIVKLGVPADDRHPRIYLRNFAAAMGDFAVLQKRVDVARTFYAEAFAVAPEWVNQLSVKLTQFIMLTYASAADLLKQNLPLIEVSLGRALSYPQLQQPIIEDLFSLSLLNAELPRILHERVSPTKALMAQILEVCRQCTGISAKGKSDSEEWGNLWNAGLDMVRKRQQTAADSLRFIDSQADSLDALQEQITRLQNLQPLLPWMSDKKRLNEVSEIIGFIHNYTKQQRYLEQEMLANTIKNRIRELVDQIESSPTKLSLEYFRPYLIKIGKTVDGHFARVRLAAEPDQLEPILLIEFITPNQESHEIECHIQIENGDGKSPASAVILDVLDAEAGEYSTKQRSIKVTEALNGGERVTCIVPLVVSEAAIETRLFVLNFRLRYVTRGGRTVETDTLTLPVGLFGDEDFVPVDPNPYAAWAQGRAVEDKNMFYGRDALINRIISAIQNSQSNKSLVIYGQKRAGKSSVLYHLGRSLRPPVIPVSFSVAEVILNITLPTFLYKIMQEMGRALRKLGFGNSPTLPDLQQFEKYPELLFHQYMAELKDALVTVPGYADARFMLLLDEFADLYSAIRTERIPNTFMKAWKSMLERQYFGSVLVGSLVMRDFIDQFPNEFQVAETIRVSYLDPPDARDLIEKPIRLPNGDSRYCGSAVERLLDLTAGSPFYIQIFCNRLVNYINDKKRPISDPDIERVKDDLISGNNCLDRGSFDNLLTAGDRSVDPIPRGDVEKVLRAIAAGTKTQRWFDPTVALSSMEAGPILSALVMWEVLDRQGSLYRIRVGLFKEWLLATQ